MIELLIGVPLIVLVFAYPFVWMWLARRRAADETVSTSPGKRLIRPASTLWLPRRYRGGEPHLRPDPEVVEPVEAKGAMAGWTPFLASYLILISVVFVVLIWLDEKGPQWRYAKTLESRITACESGQDADTCLDLALKHRNGVQGICFSRTVGGRYHAGSSTSESCTLLSQDQEAANAFARRACEHGNLDGCFHAANWTWDLSVDGVTEAHVRETRQFCDDGSFAACNFLSVVQDRPASEPALPPMDVVNAACAAGNTTACLHSYKHRIGVLIENPFTQNDPRELLAIRADMVVLSYSKGLSNHELGKLNEMVDLHDAFLEGMRRRASERDPALFGSDPAGLLQRLQAIELPMPRFAGATGDG